ncbi:glycoside hydrolase family 47 protein [Xylariomycetidae sp. FL0641]|nr:glycoside hydrolase family 47 protein [Xylariomycetidae sp. FL0641]
MIPVRLTWALAALSSVSSVAAELSYVSHPERLAAIADTFQRSWDGYYTYAYPNDSLKPISKIGQNDRNGWGASAVDAFSTAIIMRNEKVVGEIIDHISNIDFNMTAPDATSVSLFETTIRYLAGMLSGYDFLTGPFSGLVEDQSSLKTVLAQAVNLADQLSVAFDTPTGIPINDLVFNGPDGPETSNTTTNGLATVGTLVLEWTRLSDLTGDERYGKLAQKGEEYLLNVQNPSVGEPYPGLLGGEISVTSGDFTSSSGGWVGGDDSYYEYLIKMYLYDSERFSDYKDAWVEAVDSSIKYLASHPTTRPDLTFLAAYNGAGPANLSFVSQHLACFDGGSFILGGLTLDNPKYVKYGLELTASCHDTYTQTATRIGPEIFQWQDSRLAVNASNNAGPPAGERAFYRRAGFWATNPAYDLRPEVIESYYYAYRATGDRKYQDWGWDAFLAINATCAAGVGYSAVNDVTVAGGGGFVDAQESFWFAEVLKYAYILQAGDAEWQVSADHDNKWVFNTEAHPFRVAGTPI